MSEMYSEEDLNIALAIFWQIPGARSAIIEVGDNTFEIFIDEFTGETKLSSVYRSHNVDEDLYAS